MAFPNLTNQNTASSAQYDILHARTIATGLSDVKPEVKRELMRMYGWDLALGDWMEEKGAKTAVNNDEVFHKEKYSIRQAFVADYTSDGSGVFVYTVESAYVSATSETQAPYVATGSRSTLPVRVQDVIEFDDGTQALVTAVSGATFDAVAIVSGDTLSSAADNTIRVISNAVGESADTVASRFSFGQGFTSVMQTIRNSETVTDKALRTVDWFDNLGEGQNSNKYYSEAVMDCYNNHKNDRDLAWLTSKQLTNATLANVSGQETTMTTEGYIPWLESNANVEEYTSGSFSLDEIDSMVAKVTKYRGSREYEIWAELTLSRQIDDFMRAETGLNAGGVVYSSAASDRYIDFGFKSFTRSGITFHCNRLPAFNYEEYLGGSRYAGMGLMMPTGNESVEVNGNNIKVPVCELLHADEDPYDGSGYTEWIHGGFSKNRTNGVANRIYEVQSCIGFRGIGSNRHGLFKES